MADNVLIIHPSDNVVIALRNIAAGEQVTGKGIETFVALEQIPSSHKIALRDIAAGEEIIKYGEVIAVSTRTIKKGAWIHTHNLESGRCKK